MELEDFKPGWKKAGADTKTQRELIGMTKISKHPSLGKIKKKLVVETILLLFISVVYYDWFDGGKKPLYANAIMLAGLLLYIANDIIGYISLAKPVMGSDLKTSLEAYLARVRLLAACSITFSTLYSVCFIVFFSSAIQLTKEKSLLLLGIAITLIQMMFWSYRTWSKWIGNLKEQVEQF